MGEARRRAARCEMPYQQGGHYDRDAEVRKLAASMDQRVRQHTATAPSISDRALIDQMLGFLPGLNQIWTTTSDDTLANLCGEYPGFYRYAMDDGSVQPMMTGENAFGFDAESVSRVGRPSRSCPIG